MTDAGFTRGLSRSARPGVDDLDWFEVYRPAPPLRFDLAGLASDLACDNQGTGQAGPASRGGRGQPGDCPAPRRRRRRGAGLREAGASPVLIPAMGSHGGATSAGQVEVLHELGVVAEALGVPVEASMEVEQVGAAG